MRRWLRSRRLRRRSAAYGQRSTVATIDAREWLEGLPRSAVVTLRIPKRMRDRIKIETGAALPTVLSLLTLACFAYVAVTILLAVLRV